MCGITGIFAFNEIGRFNLPNLSLATETLSHRGPDHQNIYIDDFVGLGHRRLSIIDLSSTAHQPMSSENKRYHLVFNGEIFNFKELRQNLTSKGINFTTESDTEVLLQMLINYGPEALSQLNGFFSFAFYDLEKQEILLARDRYGIKPLYYFQDEDRFIFGSEMRAILKFGIEKKVNQNSLFTYLQLNYLPAPLSMVEGVKKLSPGQLINVRKKSVEVKSWYKLEDTFYNQFAGAYDQAIEQLKYLMNQSIDRRLISDVPLGTFLSGGIDSSIISALVAEKTDQLHTFSIGYKGHSYFDETSYANAVAKHIQSHHQVFQLSLEDLYTYLPDMLKQLSEPFADSSALPVFALSKLTKQNVTVALSGDGADELFGGYNKHAALYKMWNPGVKENIAGNLGAIWNQLPQSRNNPFGNKVRQLSKFAETFHLDLKEQNWLLVSLQSARAVTDLLSDNVLERIDFEAFDAWKDSVLSHIDQKSINQALQLDQQMVLPGDMLQKVDVMSMAHGLEVRVPFLDHELVAFANSLPDHYKVNGKMKKRILQDAYRDKLPEKIYNRPKHGFEVPLLNWLQNQLKNDIKNKWLNPDFIESQQIFDVEGTQKLQNKLFSSNPGDSHAHVWALIVFQEWWEQFMK